MQSAAGVPPDKVLVRRVTGESLDPTPEFLLDCAALADFIPLQIWMLADPENYSFANAAHASFMGRSAASFRSVRVVEVWGISPRTDHLISLHRKIMAGRESTRTEEWTENQAGDLHLLSITRSAVFLPGGRSSALVCTACDITPEFRMKQRLTGAELLHRAVVELSRDGILICRGDALRLVNDSLCSMLGYSKEELLSKSFDRLIHPDDREEVKVCMGCRSAGHLIPRTCRARLMTSGGDPRLYDLSVSKVIYEGEAAVLAVLTESAGREPAGVTSRPSIAGEDQGGNPRFIAEQVSGIAHDLNNMLTAMGGNVELAMSHCSPAATRNLREALAACSRGGELTLRLAQVVTGLPAPESRIGKRQPDATLRVLLVADDEMMRAVAVEMLEKTDCIVETAAGGADAVDRYSLSVGTPQAFDLVMLDISTGGAGFAGTAGMLRERWPEVGLILSGGTGIQYAVSTSGYGPSVVLGRPYSLEQLRSAVLKVLEG
jgi:PAS domain S-box-containing protein